MFPLARSRSAVFLLNSCMGRFSAPPRGGPLLPKLRGCFAEFLDEVSLARLGASAHPPTCVGFGTARAGVWTPAFLGARAPGAGGGRPPPPGRFRGPLPEARARTGPSGPPHARGNVDPLSIGYASRPGLRRRLTPGGRTCPGKPWDSGGRDSHPAFRYSCPHHLRLRVHGRSRAPLRARSRAPLPIRERGSRRFGTALTPDHFRRGTSRPVSCYALFKWWLPLSQHPGCHRSPTSLVTRRRLGAFAGGLGCFPLDRGA